MFKFTVTGLGCSTKQAFWPNPSKWSRHPPITCGFPSLHHVLVVENIPPTLSPHSWLSSISGNQITPVRSQEMFHTRCSTCCYTRKYCHWTKRKIPFKTTCKDLLNSTKTKILYFLEKQNYMIKWQPWIFQTTLQKGFSSATNHCFIWSSKQPKDRSSVRVGQDFSQEDNTMWQSWTRTSVVLILSLSQNNKKWHFKEASPSFQSTMTVSRYNGGWGAAGAFCMFSISAQCSLLFLS